MHIKRWLLLLLFGITFLSLGVGYAMVQIYRTQPFPEWVAYATLQFIDRPIRAALFLLIGLRIVGLAVAQLSRSMLAPFLTDGGDNIFDRIHQHRHRQRGPKVVAIGGGTGLSTRQ